MIVDLTTVLDDFEPTSGLPAEVESPTSLPSSETPVPDSKQDGPEILEVGRKRLKPTNAAVALRVQGLKGRLPEIVRAEGVHPLNPGFFQLEAMRMGAGAKKKTAQRTQMKG